MGIACMEYLGKKYKQENEDSKEKTSADEKLDKEASEEV